MMVVRSHIGFLVIFILMGGGREGAGKGREGQAGRITKWP